MQGNKLQEQWDQTRINNWLWLYLDRARKRGGNWGGKRFPADSLARENVRDYLISEVGELRVGRLLKTKIGRYFLHHGDLNWIDGSERQTNWLESYLDEVLNIRVRPRPPSLFGRNLVVALIDLCELDLQEKARRVNKMEEDWNEHRNNDVIFKWFKGKDEKPRCELAWSWLRENKGNQTYGYAPTSSLEQLLIFYDRLTENIAEKKLDVAAIKKRWSQQEYRKNMVGRKQYNFVLSDQSIKKLDKLADRYQLSRPQILEALIHFESENSSYLPETIKKRWELS